MNNSTPKINGTWLYAAYQYEYTAYLTLTLIIAISGCLLSGTFLAVLLRRKSLFSSSRYLIISQTIAEMLLNGFFLPSASIGAYAAEIDGSGESVFFNTTFCVHHTFFFVVTVAVSMWGLFALALNRFCAINIVQPHLYQRFTSPAVQCVQIILICTLSVIINLYNYMPNAVATAVKPLRQCYSRPSQWYAVRQVIGTYLPLALTAALYILIALKLLLEKRWQNHRQVKTTTPQSNKPSHADARRINLAKILCITATVHSVTFLLYPLARSFQGGEVLDPVTPLWFRSVFNLGLLSSPISFFIMSRDCQQDVIRLFRCKKIAEGDYSGSHTHSDHHSQPGVNKRQTPASSQQTKHKANQPAV
ncbi:histamine H2 receptor-like [Paramacrobiotus metropolitanus]|uniref:histamine H2 receptor-like n=1 Tax=Paramacrobiotus metropolitanus TaxID=2943436 RepID=UPI002445BABB|nr:histamine H2 receptor-like [Paramacrobiotus metropolitanus]